MRRNKHQHQKRQKLILGVLKKLGLVLILSSCVALPKPPNTPLCLYDNYSKNESVDHSKTPVFHCSAANGSEYEIPWNSPSAKNMVSTPHKDYVELNAYYKKIFEVFEKEFLNKAGIK